MTEGNGGMERAIEALKEPVQLGDTFDQRVMAEIESGSAPSAWAHRFWAFLEWLRRGRPVSVSPLGGLALAAGIAVVVLLGRSRLEPEGQSEPIAATASGSVVQFVIVEPAAAAVSLVGDFNDWSAAANPMQRMAGNGVWSVTVPLTPGRYRYAFLVDGSIWLSDPSAPPALDDEFGRPGSVVTIGEL